MRHASSVSAIGWIHPLASMLVVVACGGRAQEPTRAADSTPGVGGGGGVGVTHSGGATAGASSSPASASLAGAVAYAGSAGFTGAAGAAGQMSIDEVPCPWRPLCTAWARLPLHADVYYDGV
jgi:hypothetical protein